MEGSRPDRVGPDQRPRDGRSRRLSLPIGNGPRQQTRSHGSSPDTRLSELRINAIGRVEERRERERRHVPGILG